jgi:hypothetical protein
VSARKAARAGRRKPGYDLRKLLEAAGLGPAEAMREQPDEARLKRLVDRSRIV